MPLAQSPGGVHDVGVVVGVDDQHAPRGWPWFGAGLRGIVDRDSFQPRRHTDARLDRRPRQHLVGDHAHVDRPVGRHGIPLLVKDFVTSMSHDVDMTDAW
ncbi:hypothetical protein FRIGORI9N_410025 [Frigoribacterium sp. 9N]|nr:hypothetical protein FRIGORI9N_410025 [Frigoribacterium sp. 9N]